MQESRGRSYNAMVAFAFACLVLCSGRATAQGALRVNGSRPAAPAMTDTALTDPAATDAAASLKPARTVLQRLVGRWHFAIWFAGNLDGPPDASGTRVVEPLYDDLRVQWTEVLDDTQSRSQGTIGFDSRSERFVSSAVYSDGAGMEFLTGTLNTAEPAITFSPLAPSPAAAAHGDRRLMESFTLTLIDADHFTWAPLDHGWRAVFTREPAPVQKLSSTEGQHP